MEHTAGEYDKVIGSYSGGGGCFYGDNGNRIVNSMGGSGGSWSESYSKKVESQMIDAEDFLEKGM